MKTYIIHANIVLADRVLTDASLLIEDGVITKLNADMSWADEVVDLHGQWLMPGIVDLHCDAIEKEVEPRARVMFPMGFACTHVDRRNAAAGITTPYHAISFANSEWGVRNNETASDLARAIVARQPDALVDNRVHIRYEITDTAAVEYIQALMNDGCVDLLSIMDHTPGQGQFKHLESYLSYMIGNHGVSREEAARMAESKMLAREDADDRVLQLMELARRLEIPTASHDDDRPERVAAMRELGAVMSEFPINLETAHAAHAAGLATILGAPNVLRGGSQSGSMRALDAIQAGVGDILCADYAPNTLLAAVFALYRKNDIQLPAAAKLVTHNPAVAAGLHDRGRIAEGLRADLIAVRELPHCPVVTHVWSAGRSVYQAQYPAAVRGYPSLPPDRLA